MTRLTWDQPGDRLYETGVDHGVLYIPNGSGIYDNGVVWNGLTGVTESPSGGESSKQYADNMNYLNLMSAEEFGGTIEALTYPSEFEIFDGSASPIGGLSIGQQGRKAFGFCYRTLLGNDLEGSDLGYKLHLVYGVQVQPTEKAYSTKNESPEPTTFSWSFTTTPLPVVGYKPVSSITIDSTLVDPLVLMDLEEILFGTETTNPRLPSPQEIFEFFVPFNPFSIFPTATASFYSEERNWIPPEDGEPVQFVLDGTGNAYHVNNANPAASPTFVSSVEMANGRPAIRFALENLSTLEASKTICFQFLAL